MFKFIKNLVQKISNVNESIAQYKEVTRQTTIPSKAYVNWGVHLATSGNMEEALEKFKASSYMRPQNPESFNNWGITLATMERFEEAIEKFKEALKIDHKNVKSHMLWGAALVELGRFEEAEDMYGKALELKPKDPEIYINWGISLARQERKTLAEMKFRKAFELNPRTAQAVFLLGVVLTELERYDEAIEKLEMASGIQPNNPDAWHFYSIALFKKNLLEEAFEKSKTAVNMRPTKVDYQVNMAEILIGLGKPDKALECYHLAEKTDPEHAGLYSSWGITLQKEGEYHESVQKLELSIKFQKKENAKTTYHLALSKAEIGELDAAEKMLEDLIENDPKYYEAYIKLGSISCARGNYPGAIERYKQAVKFPSRRVEANYLIASAYTYMGQYEESLEYYKNAIECDHNHLDSYIGSAVALNELEDDKEAIRKIRKAYQLAPDSAQVNMIYGVILLKNDKTTKDAIEKLENTIKLEPDNLAAIIGKGEALMKMKKYDETISFLSGILFNMPDLIPAIFIIGAAYEEKGDISSEEVDYLNATQYYAKVLSFDPHHIGSLSNIAYIKAKMGKTEFFEDELRRLYKTYPDEMSTIRCYFDQSIEKLDYKKNFEDIIYNN